MNGKSLRFIKMLDANIDLSDNQKVSMKTGGILLAGGRGHDSIQTQKMLTNICYQFTTNR